MCAGADMHIFQDVRACVRVHCFAFQLNDISNFFIAHIDRLEVDDPLPQIESNEIHLSEISSCVSALGCEWACASVCLCVV